MDKRHFREFISGTWPSSQLLAAAIEKRLPDVCVADNVNFGDFASFQSWGVDLHKKTCGISKLFQLEKYFISDTQNYSHVQPQLYSAAYNFSEQGKICITVGISMLAFDCLGEFWTALTCFDSIGLYPNRSVKYSF